MSVKRAALYGATLLLLAAAVYLAWPRAGLRGAGRAARSSGRTVPPRSSSTALGAFIRSGAAGGPRLAVSGTVRDAATSTGIGGVSLAFRAGDTVVPATSAPDGTYRLELSAGLYEVTLKADEHAAGVPRPLVLIQAEPVSGLDFWLQRTGSVSGRVIDAHGKALSGALVTLQEARGAGSLETARTPARSDAQGRFSLRVPPGEVVLRADAERLGAALSRPVYVLAGMHLSGIEIVLDGGAALTGQVLAPDDTPVAGAEVLIKDPLGLRRLACDGQGHFSASGLVPGSKQVQAVARGFAPSQVTELQVQLGAARSLIVRLGQAKGLAGRVLSPEGAPVAGAAVSVVAGGPSGPLEQLAPPLEALTDAAGGFQFADVPDLPLTVTARGPGNAVTSRPGVPPGSLNVVLRLEATGSIVGSVSDVQGGRAVTDFTVTLTDGPGISRAGHGIALRVASAKGEFAIEELLPGSYSLTVSAPEYGAARLNNLAVVAGGAARADAALEGAGRIGGLVVDSRGVGVPGASVRVDTGWFGAAVITDANGGFLIRDVGRGRRSLSVSHPEFDTRVLGGITVFGRETATVRVELSSREGSKPGLTLTGIGVTLKGDKGHLTVVDPVAGAPAEIAGLRAGDLVTAIDGQAAGKLGFSEAVEALRGAAGTPVRLQVQRGEQSLELYIIRGDVKMRGS